MLENLRSVPLDTARATIAECMLAREPSEVRLGQISLHDHQRAAVVRIQRIIAEYGGALLCDDVGLGKTYVALAVAASCDAVTIVAPATLAPMWKRALTLAGVTATFISAESLGRSGAPNERRALIIVDEAHHFRNSCTRRYAALARMCMLTPVLLLTATPIHNTRDDLAAVIALFRGSRAYAMCNAEFAAMIVRRSATDGDTGSRIPVIEQAPARVLATDESVLDRILALPPPVPPSDGSVAAQLVMHGLARQWTSSNAALIGALKRRIARSHGLLASLDAGRYPSTRELSAWVYTGDAVQLAFAELLAPAVGSLSKLASALRAHVHALSELLEFARSQDGEFHARFIRDIRRAHPGEKIVAFSCYAETAEAVFRSLMRDCRVALLTARGGRIASGPVGRATVLGQFAPAIGAQPAARPHEIIDILVATDLLSEGVDLQEASIVVHLDIPWTKARIDQRAGRLARIGSRHDRVVSYSVNPPPRAEKLLRELETIARKAGFSAELLGGTSIGARQDPDVHPSTVASAESTRSLMRPWIRPEVERGHFSCETCCAARAIADRTVAIGVWVMDGACVLLEWNPHEGITAEADRVEAAVTRVAIARERRCGEIQIPEFAGILSAAQSWYEQRCAWIAAGGTDSSSSAPAAPDSRRILARVADATSSGSGFARRAQSAAMATRLRAAAASPLPIAIEWSLESLAESPDEASVNTILDLVDHARSGSSPPRETGFRCVVLILMTPEST